MRPFALSLPDAHGKQLGWKQLLPGPAQPLGGPAVPVSHFASLATSLPLERDANGKQQACHPQMQECNRHWAGQCVPCRLGLDPAGLQLQPRSRLQVGLVELQAQQRSRALPLDPDHDRGHA